MTTTPNAALNEPPYNQSGWDSPLNNNFQILEGYLSSIVTVSYSSPSTVTNILLSSPVSNPLSSTLGQLQSMVVIASGTLTANSTLTLPATYQGRWVIKNSTTGAYTLTVKTAAAGTNKTVVVPKDYAITVYSNGTDIIPTNDGIINSGANASFGTLGLSGALTGVSATFSGNISAVDVTSTGNLSVTGNGSIGGKLTAQGSTSTLGALVNNISEAATVSATAATGTINFDVTTQSVLYYTTNASANFTINLRGNSTTTLNSILSTGQAITVVFMNTNGSTAYYASAFTIDGSAVTPKWIGGVAPTSGNVNSIDTYSYTAIKTGSGAYTVLASITKFA